MMLRIVALIGCAVLGVASNAAATEPTNSKRPNIVLMFADDLGYGDLACYGHPYAETPFLDTLAAEGTRFTQFYVTGVTCNPSRTGLMTGRHPARYEQYTADFGFGNRETITQLLSKQGYATGHFGKWHIGPETAHGTYGIDVVDVIGKSKRESAGRDDDLYSAAIKFITANADQPFYVNVWGHATHYPVDTPDRLAKKFADVQVDRDDFSATMQPKFDECVDIGSDLDVGMRQYLGDVYQIDRNVGRVMQTLDDLGIADNTIVVFSSDHGPAPVGVGAKAIREFSPNMLGSPGPYRGGKHQQYEGGVRVPCIVRWPGHVEAGRVEESSVCSFIDWLPTLAALTGIDDVPKDLDGEDISDIWLGQSRSRRQPLFWKTSTTKSTPAVREGRWKFHMPPKQRGDVELYDLRADPGESRNVASEHPDVVARMTKTLRKWTRELPSTYEKTPKKSRRK